VPCDGRPHAVNDYLCEVVVANLPFDAASTAKLLSS